jgi:inhibitor of cysteine peptidase
MLPTTGVLLFFALTLGPFAYLADTAASADVTWHVQLLASFTPEQVKAMTRERSIPAFQDALAARIRGRGATVAFKSLARGDGGVSFTVSAQGDGGLGQFKQVVFDDLGPVGGLLGGPISLTLTGDVRTGENLPFALESSPGTGYLWDVKQLDETRLRRAGPVQLASKVQLLGAPMKQTVPIQGTGTGRTTLTLFYRRPWESNRAPTRTVALQAARLSMLTDLVNPAAPKGKLAAQGHLSPGLAKSSQVLPATWDWRSQGVPGGIVSPARDQGACGSCWAFGSVGVLESQLIWKGTDAAPDIAEQYLVACNLDGWGCDGGWWAHDYHIDRKPAGENIAGGVQEWEFPYSATDGTCAGPYGHPNKLDHWYYVGNGYSVPSADLIKSAIYNYGPIGVALCAGPALSAYSGGVFSTDEKAQCGFGQVNHAVLLVGWDDATSPPSWIMKNSWGTSWGPNGGFANISRTVSNIGFGASYVTYTPPTSSARVEIDHTSIGDLAAQVGVGNPSSPACSLWVDNRHGGSVNDIYESLDVSACASHLPPSATNKWFLSVYDGAGGHVGQIRAFEVKHNGVTYRAADTPIAITDRNTSISYVTSGGTPATTWVTKAPMPTARGGAAVAAVNGKVYVIGGESQAGGARPVKSGSTVQDAAGPAAYEQKVEEYSPATNAWATQAAKPTAVGAAGAAAIDGKIYVPGGYNGTSGVSVLEIYNPTTNTWSSGAPLPAAQFASAVAAVNGKLYVLGGTTNGGAYLDTCWVYDPSANRWATCAAMRYARGYAAAGVVNGRVYVVGGRNLPIPDFRYVEEYNPATNAWTTRAPMATARGGPGAVGYGAYLYVCGGGWNSYLRSCDRYNPTTNTWSVFEPLNVGRRSLGMVEVNGKLYAAGGEDGGLLAANEENGNVSAMFYLNLPLITK